LLLLLLLRRWLLRLRLRLLGHGAELVHGVQGQAGVPRAGLGGAAGTVCGGGGRVGSCGSSGRP
jgi:hypothetical protein